MARQPARQSYRVRCSRTSWRRFACWILPNWRASSRRAGSVATEEPPPTRPFRWSSPRPVAAPGPATGRARLLTVATSKRQCPANGSSERLFRPSRRRSRRIASKNRPRIAVAGFAAARWYRDTPRKSPAGGPQRPVSRSFLDKMSSIRLSRSLCVGGRPTAVAARQPVEAYPASWAPGQIGVELSTYSQGQTPPAPGPPPDPHPPLPPPLFALGPGRRELTTNGILLNLPRTTPPPQQLPVHRNGTRPKWLC